MHLICTVQLMHRRIDKFNWHSHFHFGTLKKISGTMSSSYEFALWQYSALLWHRLMGKGVLAVNSNASPYLRVYAHCAKEIVRYNLIMLIT